MTTFPNAYDHKTRETFWQQEWEKRGIYHWQNDRPRDETYVIDTPPPTVSGLLHMGHVFSYTHADFIARYQRMKGKDVFYPMGFDDNGLPTERLVEKTKKVRATDMSREAFIALCEEVSAEARVEFRALFSATALSVDWRQEYHTISEHSRRVSQASFLDLYEKGQVSRRLQPMLWDVIDQTAIAQAEVEDKEMSGVFCDIRFGVEDDSGTPSPSGRGLGEGFCNYNPQTLIEYARHLRQESTEPEHIMWSIVRDRQLLNAKFRRQHSIEPYIVDFYCHEAMVVIELDGGQHGFDENQSKEKERTVFLEKQGLQVLRFWNNEILENIEGVVETILQALTPTLSQREKELCTPSALPQENKKVLSFVIGTTRPEMLPACVAIFYHPDDVRYQHLKGKYAITPLFGVRVPILEDDTVEPDKGTGIMMCCTFGDEADIVKWRKHGLDTKIILNKYGKLDLPNHPELNALKATVAREKIIEMLRDSGDLEGIKPISHAVKCAERSGAPLEYLPTQQWFVNVLEHKAELKEKSAQCQWHPQWMSKRMDQWIDGLSWDWCISRQRYYGVPFPVWYMQEKVSEFSYQQPNSIGVSLVDSYGKEVKIIVPDEKFLPINPLDRVATRRYFESQGYTSIAKLGALPDHQIRVNRGDAIELFFTKNGKEYVVFADTDVMDTWATSALSPQISAWNGNDDTANFPHPNQRSEALFPADLRPQAHEIIRTWAFYTLAKAHLHHDSIPWKNLMISGWCLASDKTKMSKSKGNVVTPTALLEAQSADAVRYWASTSKLGADTAFSEDLLKIGRKLVTKLWNASKFAATIMAEAPHLNLHTLTPDDATITYTLDQWMMSRIRHIIIQSDKNFALYDYSTARHVIEYVFWNDFCDNYLELVKSRAYGNMGEAAQQSAVHTIWFALNALLKLFAPYIPHITEEIYHVIYSEEAMHIGSIHARGNFPDANGYAQNLHAEEAGEVAVALLELVRRAKSEKGVSIKTPIAMAYVSGVSGEMLTAIENDVRAAGSINTLHMQEESVPTGAITLHDEERKLTVHLVFEERIIAN